jgi:LacI family transcriptional regulator
MFRVPCFIWPLHCPKDMATIKEVAQRAGVSVGTVSNVLSNVPTVNALLRRRVENAIKQLRYRPNQIARSLKKQTTNTLGLIISDITNPFFPAIVRGAQDEAEANGYALSIFNSDDRVEQESRALDIFEGRRVDGVMLVPSLEGESTDALERLLSSGTPLLTLDRELQNPVWQQYPIDAVVVSNREGVADAVRRIAAAGAQRIACIAGEKKFYNGRERLAGFEAGLRSAKLKKHPELIWFGDFREATGYQAVKDHFASCRPDGLFVANILMCLGAMRALEELGVVPGRDLQLVTFDHLPLLEYFRPRIAAVAQPTYEIGRAAVRTMLERLEDRTLPARRIVLPTEWHPGDTLRNL